MMHTLDTPGKINIESTPLELLEQENISQVLCLGQNTWSELLVFFTAGLLYGAMLSLIPTALDSIFYPSEPEELLSEEEKAAKQLEGEDPSIIKSPDDDSSEILKEGLKEV